MPSLSRLYGKGVFTTVRIVAGAPLFWEKHWRRLTTGADIVGIDLSEYEESSVRRILDKEIESNGITEGRCRITFADENESDKWRNSESSGPNTSLLMIVAELGHRNDELKISASPFTVNSRSPLAGVKTCNYLENILAINEAKGRGFHEAIRVNESGFVSSACMANVFWLKDDEIFTPGLSTGCLAGTTREYVLENLECSEVEAQIDVVDNADAIFLTSAGRGIARVIEYNERHLDGFEHPILDLWPPSSK